VPTQKPPNFNVPSCNRTQNRAIEAHFLRHPVPAQITQMDAGRQKSGCVIGGPKKKMFGDRQLLYKIDHAVC
jgi:hypothetical protein